MKRFEGKVALVTGAVGGIDKTIVHGFRNQGMRTSQLVRCGPSMEDAWQN